MRQRSPNFRDKRNRNVAAIYQDRMSTGDEASGDELLQEHPKDRASTFGEVIGAIH